MARYKDYYETINSIYQLKTKNEEEINDLYNQIKSKLIETNSFSLDQILAIIRKARLFNNRYTNSYFTLYKKIKNEYYPNDSESSIFESFKRNVTGPLLTKNNVIRKNPFDAILNDDKDRYETFSRVRTTQSNVCYPYTKQGFSLLEACCYHGSINCFNHIRTKPDQEITKDCLKFSFLGGNVDIINECLKVQKPTQNCMVNAIISHNIEFVNYLMNEYKLEINLFVCGIFNNLEAFLVYLCRTKDINKCLIYSPSFHNISLCDYLISLGADINAKDHIGWTPLHYAAQCNSKDVTEHFISFGADIDAKSNNGWTALHAAAQSNSIESAKILISYGADINAKDIFGQTALFAAKRNNHSNFISFLISMGIDSKAKDNDGKDFTMYKIKSPLFF